MSTLDRQGFVEFGRGFCPFRYAVADRDQRLGSGLLTASITKTAEVNDDV